MRTWYHPEANFRFPPFSPHADAAAAKLLFLWDTLPTNHYWNWIELQTTRVNLTFRFGGWLRYSHDRLTAGDKLFLGFTPHRIIFRDDRPVITESAVLTPAISLLGGDQELKICNEPTAPAVVNSVVIVTTTRGVTHKNKFYYANTWHCVWSTADGGLPGNPSPSLNCDQTNIYYPRKIFVFSISFLHMSVVVVIGTNFNF